MGLSSCSLQRPRPFIYSSGLNSFDVSQAADHLTSTVRYRTRLLTKVINVSSVVYYHTYEAQTHLVSRGSTIIL